MPIAKKSKIGQWWTDGETGRGYHQNSAYTPYIYTYIIRHAELISKNDCEQLEHFSCLLMNIRLVVLNPPISQCLKMLIIFFETRWAKWAVVKFGPPLLMGWCNMNPRGSAWVSGIPMIIESCAKMAQLSSVPYFSHDSVFKVYGRFHIPYPWIYVHMYIIPQGFIPAKWQLPTYWMIFHRCKSWNAPAWRTSARGSALIGWGLMGMGMGI